MEFDIPDFRERFVLRRDIVREKLETSLLPAMRHHGIDMWIVFDRENNPDPLHDELGGGFSGSGAVFMFHDDGGRAAEKIYFGSSEQPLDSDVERFYDQTSYYGGDTEELNRRLREAVNQRNPNKTAVNVSESQACSDGLTVSSRDCLVKALGPELSARMVSAVNLVHEFRSRRTSLRDAPVPATSGLDVSMANGAPHFSNRARGDHGSRRRCAARRPSGSTRIELGHRPWKIPPDRLVR